MNTTNITTEIMNLSSNMTFFIEDPCRKAFGDYANAYNMGKAAIMTQISNLLLVIIAGLLIAAFVPKLQSYCKTDIQKQMVHYSFQFGMTLALAAALFTYGLQFIDASVRYGP